jgi:tetratricopeptide (TPR) repeat protein
MLVLGSPGSGVAAGEPPFWVAAAQVGETRAASLAAEAAALAARGRLDDAEAHLAGAAALRPADVATASALADLQALRGRDLAAAATLERALALGPAGTEPGLWLQLGALRAKLGRYREAAAAYGAATAMADGAASTDLYANLAEVLMADGRLPEAEARYRDAIAVAGSETTGERRSRSQDIALAYYGLAVALDRDGQPSAAREAIARALAQDPGGAVLKVATIPNRDLFFVPDGDVYYYLGLAAEVEGRAMDAEAAFREFLARRPDSRWAGAATAHLAPPGATPSSRPGAPGHPSARVVAFGTVQTSGGVPAPLIDAAWRARPGLLDECLEETRGGGSVRIGIEVDLDARGRVTRATLETPGPLGAEFARCAEAAVTHKLAVSGPTRGKPTHARTEIIIAFP